MTKLKVLSLFAGIGGFDLGLERTGGFETVAFSEIDPFCRRVLRKHWPTVKQYEDVRELTADVLLADGLPRIDVICGGSPCQDLSVANMRSDWEGLDGERSGLWSEFARLIGEVRPQYVLLENVSVLLRRGFGRILGRLAEIGYDSEWHSIPASSIGAPHLRDRVWLVAYPNSERLERQHGDRKPTRHFGRSSDGTIRRLLTTIDAKDWLPEPGFCRVANGFPDRVDRLNALGNAVVPQIPEMIGRAILNARLAGQVTA